MNAIQKATAGYGKTAEPIRTHRGTEYEAIARITSQLKRAAGQNANRFGLLAHALHDNRRLWATLAANAADSANGLPRELRARIVYLAEFTRIHSAKVLKSSATAEPLIEINTAVMRGLRDRNAAS